MEEEEEEEIYLAQTQQIKCKYKSHTIQLSRVTGKPEGQLCWPPEVAENCLVLYRPLTR